MVCVKTGENEKSKKKATSNEESLSRASPDNADDAQSDIVDTSGGQFCSDKGENK